jgi:hypothetical protein
MDVDNTIPLFLRAMAGNIPPENKVRVDENIRRLGLNGYIVDFFRKENDVKQVGLPAVIMIGYILSKETLENRITPENALNIKKFLQGIIDAKGRDKYGNNFDVPIKKGGTNKYRKLKYKKYSKSINKKR